MAATRHDSRPRFKCVLFLALWVLAWTPAPALAYIDPASGGMLFQALAIVFASISGAFLFFSRQIRTFVASMRRRLRGLGLGNSTPGDDPVADDPAEGV